MDNLIFGALLYVPPFFKVAFFGFFLWLFIRPWYRKPLYNGYFWHPNLVDISILVTCTYACHRLLLHVQGIL